MQTAQDKLVKNMDAGVNKRFYTSSAITGLVSFIFCFLSSPGNVHAVGGENDEALAKKFAPILVLTENPTVPGRIIVNPEPVEIVGADSVSNVWIEARNLVNQRIKRAPLSDSWNPSLPHDAMQTAFPEVDFSQNQFAFLSPKSSFYNGILPGFDSSFNNIILRPLYFNYPGNDRESWNNAYLGHSKNGAYAGHRFRNTVYARVFDRPNPSDGNGAVVIKYFSFYPFNDWENNHEGDWQKINVIVTSRDTSVAEFYGIDYLFHGKSITYYDVTDSLSSINIRERISPVGGKYPVAYVSVGGHGHYPTPGDYPSAGEVTNNDNLTPHGLVLHPGIVDSDTSIAQSYDLVLLPQPDTTQTNMGLPDSLSWLGARLFWGTPEVPSPLSIIEGLIALIPGAPNSIGNDAPLGPLYSGWSNIRVNVDANKKYDKDNIPSDYERFHNFPIVGNVAWSDTVSLRGDIVVFPGATLTIKPGTVIEFEPESDIHKFSPSYSGPTLTIESDLNTIVMSYK